MPALSSAKWEAFAQALAKGEHVGNASACYKLVYGKEDRAAASRLQRRSDISQRVVEIRAEITAQEAEATRIATEKLGISKEWVLQHLVENVQRGLQHKAVLDEDGAPVGEFKYDGSTVNKALELLGKHVGMFIPAPVEPQGVSVNVGVELVDRPPRETREQWEERRKRELGGKTGSKGK